MSDSQRRARIESDLMERIAVLRSQGPGDVRVARVNEILAVRKLRECREMLDDDESVWLAEMLDLLKREAFGIQVSGLSRITQEAQVYRPDIDLKDPADKAVRWIGYAMVGGLVGLSFRLLRIDRLLDKMSRRPEVARSGSPLPAPENLILAAEAWALATLCMGRLNANVDSLREPWEQASVDT